MWGEGGREVVGREEYVSEVWKGCVCIHVFEAYLKCLCLLCSECGEETGAGKHLTTQYSQPQQVTL